jgi:tyrosine-protein phosphatase YwqE
LKTLTLDTTAGYSTGGSVSAYLNDQLVFGSRPLTATQVASYDFNPGDNVQLRAEADLDNYFAGYNGSITSSSRVSNVSMNDDKYVTAAFNKSFNNVHKFAITSQTGNIILPNGKILFYGQNSTSTTLNSVYNKKQSSIFILNQDLTIDDSFQEISFNGNISDVAADNNQNIWVVGDFTSFTGSISSEAAAAGITSGQANNANRIAKLNSSGVLQQISSADVAGTTGNGFNSTVNCITISGSNVWVGGQFATYYGASYGTIGQTNNANRIAKLNSSGVLQLINDGDVAGVTSNGFSSTVNCITIDSSGNIWAGGAFTVYYGASYGIIGQTNNANRIAKLNSSGVLQQISAGDVAGSSGNGFSGTILCITIDSSGNIWVGGTISTYYGATSYGGRGTANNANSIAKLNSSGVLQQISSADVAGTTGNGFNSTVNCITIDSSGNTWVGGLFQTYKGAVNNANRIAKLNSSGVLQQISAGDVAGTTGNGFNASPRKISIASNGNVVISGSFSCNFIENKIISTLGGAILKPKLNEYGQSTGKHYVDYTFNYADYNPLYPSLNVLSGPGTSLTTSYKVKILPNGKIAIFGSFNIYYNDKKYTNFAIINPPHLSSQPDSFQIDSFFSPVEFNGTVRDMAVDSSGNIWVVGDFTSFTGPISSGAAAAGITSGQANNANRIAKLNSSGVLQQISAGDVAGSTGNGFNNNVNCITISGSNVWVGGLFQVYYGASYGTKGAANNANRIAKLNSSGVLQQISAIDAAGSSNNGFNTSVSCITIDSSGNTWVGGSFTIYQGSPRVVNGVAETRNINNNANYIAKLNSSGVLQQISAGDVAGTTGNGFDGGSIVNCITIDSSGNIWVGGSNMWTYYGASSYGGRGTANNARYIAKLNSSGVLQRISSTDVADSTGNGFNNNVNCITIDSSGNIWVGGSFTFYFGSKEDTINFVVNRIAKLNSSGVLQQISNVDALVSNINNNGFSDSVISIVHDQPNNNVYLGLSPTNNHAISYVDPSGFINGVNRKEILVRGVVLLKDGNSTKTR